MEVRNCAAAWSGRSPPRFAYTMWSWRRHAHPNWRRHAHPNCGGHAYSADGKDWTLHNTPAYTTTITTAAGVGHPFARRERPHLLFGDDGVTPRMLFTSLTYWSVGHKPPNDKAFTFAQAIKQ